MANQKALSTVGIDYDAFSLRVVKLVVNRSGTKVSYSLTGMDEVYGNFEHDDELAMALRKLRAKVGFGTGDLIVSCVSGKQVYAAQQPFRRLPADEMTGALKLEIRKSLPFEVAGATTDYHLIEDVDPKSEQVQMIVAATAHGLLERHLAVLGKAEIKPNVVEVLPFAVANAFWVSHPAGGAVEGHVIVHVGPDVTTLVLVGELTPFFHRNIYFNAAELMGENRDQKMPLHERERRIGSFLDEVVRSLSYYETSHRSTTFSNISVMGNYVNAELCGLLFEKTGLMVVPLDIVGQINHTSTVAPAGKFDVAVALAMRDE